MNANPKETSPNNLDISNPNKTFYSNEENHPLTKFTPEKSSEKEFIIDCFKDALTDQFIDWEFVQFEKVGSGKETCIKDFNIDQVLEKIETVANAITLFQQKTGVQGKWNLRLDEQERFHVIGKVIVQYLLHHGFFICDQFGLLHYFDENDKEVINLCDEKNTNKPDSFFLSKIIEKFNLRKKTQFVVNFIISHAQLHHEKRNVFRVFYFDDENKLLYVYAGEKYYFKLDGDKIETHVNGTHLLFKESQGTKLKQYIPLNKRETNIPIRGTKYKTGINFLDLLVNGCNFDENSNLTQNEQRLQLTIQLLIFPFSSIIHTKPIMLFLGKTGSGKSFALQTFGKFLFGNEYALSALPDKVTDYSVALANRPIYFTDNVDKYVDWLAELIVAVSTGACLPQRELYKNWTLTERVPQSMLAFTSRTGSSFKRDDSVDRSLLFHVQVYEKKIDPSDLWKPLKDFHNELYSEYLDWLNKIVLTFKTVSFKDFSTEHRLVGWAKFAKIADIGLELNKIYKVNFDDFLEHVMYEKATFVFKDPILIPLLKRFAEQYKEQWFSASEMIEKLKELDSSFEYTPQKFGKIINIHADKLDILIGFQTRENRKTKAKEYLIGKKEVQSNDIDIRHFKYVPDVRDVLIPFAYIKTNNIFEIVMGNVYTHIPHLRQNNQACRGEKRASRFKIQILLTFIQKDTSEKGIKIETLESAFIKNDDWSTEDLKLGLFNLLVDGRIYEPCNGRYKELR